MARRVSNRSQEQTTPQLALGRNLLGFGAIVTIVLAAFYQWRLKHFVGVWRHAEPIEKFPYMCRRLQHKQLEACGDMWLDEENRVLYAACAGLEARNQWNPNLSRFNITGRRAGGSDLMAIYIDDARPGGSFAMHKIKPTGYGSNPGDGRLDLAGFDVEVVDSSTLRFWLLNQRPLYDWVGKLDPRRKGANTTVDVYEYRSRDRKMRYLGTGWSPEMHSPNKIASMGSNNFVVSNDRSAQTGLRRKLDPVLRGGSLVFYDDWSDKYKTTPKKLPIPGIFLRGWDDRIYVPSLVDDKIRIFQMQENNTFEEVHALKMGIPIAGLTQDSKGAIWAVGRSKYDVTGEQSTNAIFKIEQPDGIRPLKYTTSKILEDRKPKIVTGVSVARHDVKTGRLFLSGAYTPGITICEQKGL